MAAFEKGHEKTGGRRKGTLNNVTIEVKAVIDLLLPPAELERRWRKLLDSRNPWIALRAFELALAYRFGKPKSDEHGEGDLDHHRSQRDSEAEAAAFETVVKRRAAKSASATSTRRIRNNRPHRNRETYQGTIRAISSEETCAGLSSGNPT